jgi:virginiamycin A acetyltransferase
MMISQLSTTSPTVPSDKGELRQCRLSNLLLSCYRVRPLRQHIARVAQRLEGGSCFSWTLRRVLSEYHGVTVGAYSYGECLIPGAFPAGVDVGRYVSIAPEVRVFLRNHPLDRLSMHPFFYNAHLTYVENDTISTGNLSIGHDAWIGARAMIMPGCRRIGIGAVVAAGAVVTHDVDDFAIVAGVPAKLVRYRFSKSIQLRVLESRWWSLPVEECARFTSAMTLPLSECASTHPLLTTESARHAAVAQCA